MKGVSETETLGPEKRNRDVTVVQGGDDGLETGRRPI